MSLVTKPINWLRAHPYAISIIILSGLVFVSFWIDRQQNDRERREDAVERITLAEHDAALECANANESRALIRAIGVELALANAEALITVVADADPADVDRFRRQTRENAEATVAALASRNCSEEAKEARRVAADIEGIEP